MGPPKNVHRFRPHRQIWQNLSGVFAPTLAVFVLVVSLPERGGVAFFLRALCFILPSHAPAPTSVVCCLSQRTHFWATSSPPWVAHCSHTHTGTSLHRALERCHSSSERASLAALCPSERTYSAFPQCCRLAYLFIDSRSSDCCESAGREESSASW